MLPLFDISLSINIVLLLVIMAGCVLLGFLFRSRQLYKKERRICELERQMVDLDAEILQVQKEYTDLEASIRQMAIPVIPLRREGKADPGKSDLGKA